MINIACCQYQIDVLSNWASYITKMTRMVEAAKNNGAHIILLPEYAGMEIVCKQFNTDLELFTALQPLIPSYLNLYQTLAQSHQLYIQAGTIIEKISRDKFANRAYLFSPNGLYAYQDKLQLTEYEKHSKLLQAGRQQNIFETSFGKIAIAICYDSEFPEIVRPLAQQGASLVLVPSYTTTLAGFNRVYLSARARAIENQCYVAISYAINKVDLTIDIEETYGQAAILGPADNGFPDDGIIAIGQMNQPMLVTATLSLEALENVRKKGQVHQVEDIKNMTEIEDEIKIISC